MTDTGHDRRTGRKWPGYLFGGRVRTSTLALILAFVVIWWAYESYGPEVQTPDQVPAADVVPPGFIPDPAYTWVPRTDVQRTPATTTTTPTTTTSSETATTSPTTPTSPAEDGDADGDATADPTTATAATPSPSAAPGPATTPATASATTPAATPDKPTP